MEKEKIIKQVSQSIPTEDIKKAKQTPFEKDVLAYGDIRVSTIDWLSQLSAKKLWTKKPLFNISNKRIKEKWDKLFEDQNILDNILYNMETRLSKVGKVYLVVEPSIDGSLPVVRIAETGNHLKVAGKLVSANIFTTLITGQYTYNINEFYSLGKVKRSITREWLEGGKTFNRNMSSEEFRNEIGIEIKENETFNYPIPVIVVENIPTLDGNGRNDSEGLEPHFLSLQKLWNRIQWEYDANRTVILVDDSLGSSANVETTRDNAYNKMVGQGIVVEKGGISSPNESNTSLLVAQLQTEVLWKDLNKLLGYIFEVAGFKRNSDEKGTVQQNDLEIQQVRDSEITSFTRKERARQTVLKDLIKIVCAMLGFDSPRDINVDIQYMNVKNETQILENIEKELSIGIISKVDAIAKYRNTTQEDAKLILEDIKEQEEIEQPMEQLVNDPYEQVSDTGIAKVEGDELVNYEKDI